VELSPVEGGERGHEEVILKPSILSLGVLASLREIQFPEADSLAKSPRRKEGIRQENCFISPNSDVYMVLGQTPNSRTLSDILRVRLGCLRKGVFRRAADEWAGGFRTDARIAQASPGTGRLNQES
jgi:hypothetical protein